MSMRIVRRGRVGRYSLLRLLVEGSHALEGRLYEGFEAARYGGTYAHYTVFRYLKFGGSRMTEPPEAARVTQQAMGELVAYFERQVDPAAARPRSSYRPKRAGRGSVQVLGGWRR
jgi:hypothetical protein